MAAIGLARYLLASLFVIATASATSWNANCLNNPVGFGRNTVGGKGGKTVRPSNIKQLAAYLKDKNPLIIDLTTTFNFIGSEGKKQEKGCYFQKCGKGFQYSLTVSNTCQGRSPAMVTYDYAGRYELMVSSKKTIMSSNGKGRIMGKGLRVQNANDVIIRDISITDINPQVVWGGDAIALDNVQNVWIHKVTTKDIGRQHLVTYQKTNKGVTVSSCQFNGNTNYAAYCNGRHYWVWLFWGTHDEITLINNMVSNTAGRCPHAGGWSGSKNYIHLVGNYFNDNSHVTIEPYQGASVLAEGNVYQSCANVVNPKANGGQCFLPANYNDATRCQKYFGQNCIANKFSGNSKASRLDAGVLDAFSKLDKSSINQARSSVCLK